MIPRKIREMKQDRRSAVAIERLVRDGALKESISTTDYPLSERTPEGLKTTQHRIVKRRVVSGWEVVEEW